MRTTAPIRRFAENAMGARPVERLEPRTLLAAVAWDAGGDGRSWHDPLNWSTDAVPSAEDDVGITRAGTYAVEVTGAPAAAATLALGGASGRQTLLLNASLALGAGVSTVHRNGTLHVAAATLSGGPSVLLNNNGRLHLDNASVALLLSNAGVLVARGATAFTAPSLDNNPSGRILVEADDALGDATLTLSGGLENYGTLELANTASSPRDVTLDADGPLTNHASGVVYVAPAEGAGPASSGRRVLSATVANAGLLRIARDTLLDEPSARHSTSGDVRLEAGRLTVRQTGDAAGFSSHGSFRLVGGDLTVTRAGAPASFSVTGGMVEVGAGREISVGDGDGVLALEDGVLSGGGRIRASVHNIGGVVAPSPAGAIDAVGTLTVTGGYVQSSRGELEMDVGPAGNDRLIAGASSLAGALRLASPGGFDPPDESSLDLLIAGSRIGTFASVTASPLSGGRRLAASYVPGGVRAVVVSEAAPPPPDLDTSSDSGLSDADDITLDNTPRITGTADDGTTIEILSGGVRVGSATAVGGSYTVDVAPANALPDGIHVLTAHVVGGQGNRGPASAPLVVRIDATPPGVESATFLYAASPHKLALTFSESVGAAIGREDLSVERPGLDQAAFHPESVSYDAGSRTAIFSLGTRLPNGNYRAVLAAAAVVDVAGNSLVADHALDFFVLTGDVNRDRVVDSSDFVRLASNFGRRGMAYAQGDLNGDGAVNSSDFVLLAGNFGTRVPPPPAASPMASPGPAEPTRPPAVTRRVVPRAGARRSSAVGTAARRALRVPPHTASGTPAGSRPTETMGLFTRTRE